MKRDKYHSIAQRISFLFLILMIPVFLLFCLMLYIQFHYQNEASDELFVTRASNMAEMLEDEFDDINSACMDFLYDEELVRLASDLVYKTDYDLMKDYEAVIDTIASIGVNNDFIEEIQVYIPAKQRMLSDISGIHESDCSVSSFVDSDLIFIPLPGTCEDGLYSHAVAVKLDWDYINSYLNAISGGEIRFTLTGAEDMTDYGSESDGNHGYSVLVADGRYRLDISPAPETDNGILAAISICSLLAVILIAYFFILSLRYIIKPPLDGLMEGFSHLENAIVRSEALVGPYARLRPGAELGCRSHVGNFVELKKTHLGEGAKANHLTYLGDATVGAGTNIGAGTITCNYDGKHKFQTHIGENAFIGSNTAMVAPVRVGDNALIGAGSIITRDVPDNELSIARARQKNLGPKRNLGQ